MTDELVHRLRAAANLKMRHEDDRISLTKEAIKEIERLRAEVGKLRVQRAGEDVRLADAISERDRLRAEVAEYKVECRLLTHKVITCGVAASHPNSSLTKTGAYIEKWDSPQAQQVRALRDRADAAESALAALRDKLVCDCDDARSFPVNTCGASRHTQQIAEALLAGEQYPMLEEDPKYCGESIIATVTALFKERTEHAALRKRIDESARAVLQEGPGGRGYVKAHLSRVHNDGVPIGVPVALVVLGDG